MRITQEALTFDDVLLVPAESQILPKQAELHTTLTQGIDLKLNLKHELADGAKFDLGFWYSYNHNEISDYNNEIRCYTCIEKFK